MNAPVFVPVCPSGLVTTTSTAPALPAGVVQVICVAEFTATPVAALAPNFTVTVPLVAKYEPVIVTDVPPPSGPPMGEGPVTTGAGLNSSVFDALGMPLVNTVTCTYPDGKPFTGTDVNDVSDQFDVGSLKRNALCSFTKLRSSTSG